MAGAFLPGFSAAPIAAFTAIPLPGAERDCTQGAAAERRMARGGHFASRCKAALSGGGGKWLPRAIATRLRAALLFKPPGASGRSPLGKAACAAPFPRPGSPPPRTSSPLPIPARHRAKREPQASAARIPGAVAGQETRRGRTGRAGRARCASRAAGPRRQRSRLKSAWTGTRSRTSMPAAVPRSCSRVRRLETGRVVVAGDIEAAQRRGADRGRRGGWPRARRPSAAGAARI